MACICGGVRGRLRGKPSAGGATGGGRRNRTPSFVAASGLRQSGRARRRTTGRTALASAAPAGCMPTGRAGSSEPRACFREFPGPVIGPSVPKTVRDQWVSRVDKVIEPPLGSPARPGLIPLRPDGNTRPHGRSPRTRKPEALGSQGRRAYASGPLLVRRVQADIATSDCYRRGRPDEAQCRNFPGSSLPLKSSDVAASAPDFRLRSATMLVEQPRMACLRAEMDAVRGQHAAAGRCTSFRIACPIDFFAAASVTDSAMSPRT